MRPPAFLLMVAALWARWTTGAYDEKLCNEGTYDSPDTGFTYVPNSWNAEGNGFACIAVRDSPPSFDATWRWSSEPGTVHSYPHVKLTHPALPVPLARVSAFVLSAQWAMAPGSTPHSVPGFDWSGLADQDVSANAAFDLFADRDPDISQEETKAETEIMVWLARVGNAQPLGYNGSESYHARLRIGDMDFLLYYGTNQRGTSVFTWAATSRQTSFAADISPLLEYLWRNDLVSSESHLGLVGFGTEGSHADKNITFSSSRYEVEVSLGPAPGSTATPSPSQASPNLNPTATPSGARRLGTPWLSDLTICAFLGMAWVLR
ncbi:concanavalin A-like lectin/glucanase domain-containing protein [Chaetomium sp. MPI-SDFR-AT-0129]|nr:concanavalin A-like lectin/glucanase domain-containing protein [Chaetomium sp. MPI-SDFR-AT-0129]